MVFGAIKSEVELLQASLRGKPHAFGVLVGRYQSLICAITYSATGSVERSEELAQETFLKAWKNLKQLKDLSKFRAWLCRIARSTIQNWYRSHGREGTGRTVPLEAAAEKPCEAVGPMEVAMSREQEAIVSQALAQIPQNLREPLVLFYREEQSTREVAIQLGLSENAARQRISRGRAMLRAQVTSVVESAIAQTKPGKAFKTAVIAAIAGAAVKTGTTAAATSVLGLGGKLALVAAGIVVVTGAAWVVQRQSAPADKPVSALEGVETSVAVLPESGETARAAGAEAVAPEQAVQSAATVAAQDGFEPGDPVRAETVRARRTASPSIVATPFEFKPKGVFSGVVTDVETGEAIPDALVRISSGGGREVRTDANGFYSFKAVAQAGNFDVSVAALTHVGIVLDRENPIVHLRDGKQVVQDFQLAKACMVDVWVVDQNGVGIEDVRVYASSMVDAHGRAPGRFADGRSTDPNGYALLGGIPPGSADYVVTAMHTVRGGSVEISGLSMRRAVLDYAPGRGVVQLSDPNVIPQLTIVLEDGEDVRGYAEYSDGVPAADVRLTAQPAWWHSTSCVPDTNTAQDGSFTLKHITPGTYEISRHVAWNTGGGITSALTKVQLPPADGGPLVVRIPETSPQAQVSIRGIITFSGPEPLSPVHVEAASAAGGFAFGEVSRDGDGIVRFALKRLEPGRYTLTFTGTDMEDKTVSDVVAPAEDLEVEMSYAPRPKLTGTVLDVTTGDPIRRFRARARKLRSLRGVPYVLQNQWTHFDDEEGAFAVDTVGPGVYEVQIWAEGYAPRWSDSIDTDENDSVTISLTRGGMIKGRVINESGEAISDASVMPLSVASGVMPRTKTEFAGEEGATETMGGVFVLNHLPPGMETLKVTHPRYASSMARDIVVREGDTTAGVEIVLSEGATVEGYVYDAEGRPQIGETLFFQSARGYGDSNYDDFRRLTSVVTDSNGFYRAAHLPEEVCYVKRSDTYRSLGVTRRAVVPQAGAVTRLDLGGTPVVGGVVVLKGLPQAKTKLRLMPADATEVRLFTAQAVTDEHGAFAFGGVAPGTYCVYYYQQGKRRSRLMKLTTIEVTGGDVDLGVIPHYTSTLSLAIDGARANGTGAIERVYVGAPDRLRASLVRLAEAGPGGDGFWSVYDVEPGRYSLVLERADGLRWCREITLEAGAEPWELRWEIPEADAQVTGRIPTVSEGMYALWREGKDLFGYLRPDSEGYFTVENLPSGKYSVGLSEALSYDVPTLVEVQFVLGAGEHRTVDPAVAASPIPMAFVQVEVFDGSGRSRRDANIWLEGPAGRIEPVHFNAGGHCFVATPGSQKLHVEVPGYRRVERDLTLEASPVSAGWPQRVQIHLKRL